MNQSQSTQKTTKVNSSQSSHSALPNGAGCFDDLAAAHYRLTHAFPMTWSKCTTNGAQCSYDLVAAHYQMAHAVLMT